MGMRFRWRPHLGPFYFNIGTTTVDLPGAAVMGVRWSGAAEQDTTIRWRLGCLIR